MKKRNICVVLPTKNEESSIKEIINDIFKVFENNELSSPTIIIADDSKDKTRKLAKEAGAHVINGGGKGLGFAMYQGLKFTLSFKPDYIISCDADGQIDLNEIPKFLQPLENDEADIIIGSRFSEPGLVLYKYRWINRLGVRILARILTSFTGMKITDSHGGLRAMKAVVASELEMLGTHTYVQETLIDASDKGFRIKEIPSIWKKRKVGGSKVVSSIPTYIFYTLPILIIRSKQHIKWFYTTGIFLIFLGFAYFLFVSAQESFHFKAMFNRLPSFILIALFIITGIQLFFFGFIIQIIKDIKYRIDRIDKNDQL